MRVLVLTDTADYGPEATLYPLVRALAERPEVEAVHVADRSLRGNEAFYAARTHAPGVLQARQADSGFRFENQDSRPVLPVACDQANAVWMRLDLADEAFLRHAEKVWPDTFISNRPDGMIRTGSKAFLLSLQPLLEELMPPVQLCYALDNVRDFQRHSPALVLKVLNSFGGKGVVRVMADGKGDLRTDEDISRFLEENGPCLAMAYLDHPRQSDNRLIVSNGAILGAIGRTPRPGEWRCNLMAGGSYDVAAPDARETEIVRRIDPVMREHGIHFYGVDTLLNARSERMLSEVNTINAGGAYRYELKSGIPVCSRIAGDFIDNALAASVRPARPTPGTA